MAKTDDPTKNREPKKLGSRFHLYAIQNIQIHSPQADMTNARSKLIAFFIFSFLQSYFMVPVFIFTAQAVIPCIAGGRALPPERGAGAEHG